MLTQMFIELHVPDFDKARGFYEKLGFKLTYLNPEPKGYMVMVAGDIRLNFYSGTEEVYNHSHFGKSPRNSKRGYGVEIILLVDDLDSYYKEVAQSVDSIIDPLKTRSWGGRDFRLLDPFGYYIRVADKDSWSECG